MRTRFIDVATRDKEVSGSVNLLQKPDMRGHMRVDFREVGLADKLDTATTSAFEHSRLMDPPEHAPR